MLKLENITKKFQETTVLDGINLEIESGEIVSILGQSGSGKTTLLNLILGLDEPSGGEIFFNNQKITHTLMEKRPFNIVFQDYALFPNLTAYQNLTYGLRNKKECSTKAEVDELIQLLNLEKHLEKPIHQLSGGQKQRVALGRTLVMKPQLLLLDEPLSALDGVIKESIKEKIQEIARKLHLTIIIVTHDPEEALTMSDKIVVLDEGKIAQSVGNQATEHSANLSAISQYGGLMRAAFSLKRVISWSVLIFFFLFLAYPIIQIVLTAFPRSDGSSLDIFTPEWQRSFANSLKYSLAATSCSTILGFFLAYGNNFTRINRRFLKVNESVLHFPMLLPTITYGFVLIYAFGKQGLWSKVFQQELFHIYGSIGILLGFIIYTLPPIFILINNSMKYLDTQLFIVSRLMGDSWYRSLYITILNPLTRVLAVAFLQGFFMSFTDFGIPSAVGGQTPFITTLLYEGFMGTIPDFQFGSLVALTMLLPSIISILVLNYLQKKVVRYERPRQAVIKKNPVRDWCFRLLFISISLFILGVFAVLIIIPMVSNWPYELTPTFNNFARFIQDDSLILTLKNSLLMALLTAGVGTIIAYSAAILTSRERKLYKVNQVIDSIATITNSIPGMVLGVAYLLLFSGSQLHNTLLILVIVTIVHYFSTPYQMAKEALQKMNLNWENTAKLMGDSWLKTVWRILIPNSKVTIVDIFAYYFFNSMVTISAVIFLTSANTMVITAKLKELQHFGRFNDIFMLSLFLLVINLVMQGITQIIKRIASSTFPSQTAGKKLPTKLTAIQRNKV